MDTKLLYFFYRFSNKTQFSRAITAILAKYLPYPVIASYAVSLILLFYLHSPQLLRSICIPFLTLCIVSVLRIVINRARPFEKLAIQPLYFHKKGRSFPSRHTASAFTIGLTLLHNYPLIGVIVLGIAVLIGLSRICAGLHYPSDILAGCLISICTDFLFFI